MDLLLQPPYLNLVDTEVSFMNTDAAELHNTNLNIRG